MECDDLNILDVDCVTETDPANGIVSTAIYLLHTISSFIYFTISYLKHVHLDSALFAKVQKLFIFSSIDMPLTYRHCGLNLDLNLTASARKMKKQEKAIWPTSFSLTTFTCFLDYFPYSYPGKRPIRESLFISACAFKRGNRVIGTYSLASSAQTRLAGLKISSLFLNSSKFLINQTLPLTEPKNVVCLNNSESDEEILNGLEEEEKGKQSKIVS